MTNFNKHLNFYKKHKISPVTYNKTSSKLLLQSRRSLYAQLGITPLMIRGSDVLEVAPGSGQNSQFVAACNPKKFTLVEPNPTAINDIKNLYSCTQGKYTQPNLIKKRLEEFLPKQKFDLVICENWLGNSSYEKNLLKKLSKFIEVDGVLSLTAVSPIGFLPNIIRRALSARLTYSLESFEDRRDILKIVFTPHLKTISGMTRSTQDWVLDNMINPAYYDICLTAPMIIAKLGEEFEFMGSSPRFYQDWRWFKNLDQKTNSVNKNFLNSYYENCHQFLDYKTQACSSAANVNHKLEKLSFDLIGKVAVYEEALFKSDHKRARRYLSDLKKSASSILYLANKIYDLRVYEELSEGFKLLFCRDLNVEMVAEAKHFRKLFGRETIYLSFQRLF